MPETPAARPEDFDLAAFAARSFGFFEGPQEEVALRILPGGMEDLKNYRFHATQTVEVHRRRRQDRQVSRERYE